MRNKVFLIGGGLVLLIVLWIGYKNLTKDTLKPTLDGIVQINTELVALSTAAKDHITNFDLQVTAANIVGVVTTSNAYLAAYYKTGYHKKLPTSPKSFDSIKNLANAQEGSVYDSAYKSSARDLLTTNVAALKQASLKAKSQNLKDILTQLLSDQTGLLDQLPQ